MATNAEHQAAWRRRQREKIAELDALRKGDDRGLARWLRAYRSWGQAQRRRARELLDADTWQKEVRVRLRQEPEPGWVEVRRLFDWVERDIPDYLATRHAVRKSGLRPHDDEEEIGRLFEGR